MRLAVLFCFVVTSSLAQMEPSSFSMAIQQGFFSTKGCIIIKKNILCDVDFEFAAGTEIELEDGVQITVASNKTLVLNNCWLHGNQALWQGLKVEKQGILIINNSTIQDAGYAIAVEDKAHVIIRNSTFRNNYAAIYTPPSPTPNFASIQITQALFEGGTLLPSATIAGTWAYAGLLLNDFASLGMTSSNATFQNLANGIVAYRSNVTLKRAATFRNILPRNYTLPDGNAIYMKGDASNGYNLNVAGNNFNNCFNGIVSVSANLSVTDNTMNNIQNLGIESRLAQLRRITILRNQIRLRGSFNAIAINLVENDPTLSTLVSNNTLEIGPLSGPGGNSSYHKGIVLQEYQNKHLVNIMENTIRQNSESVGIEVTSNVVAKIASNTIDFQSNINIVQTGIQLYGSIELTLRCNTVGSTQNGNGIFKKTLGIGVANTSVIADCNTLSRTNIGMQIHGSCNNSLIRGNTFFNHNIGLRYTSTGVTGPQNDAGNRWLGNWNGNKRGAVNSGGASGAPNSPFIVAAGQFFPPNVLPGNNLWFLPIGNIFSTYFCLTNCLPVLPAPALALNSVDVATVNNQIPQNPIALPWELKKGLYHKLHKNPNYQLNPAMGQFYNSQQTQPIGAVVATSEAKEDAALIDSLDAVLLEQLIDNKDFLMDSLQQVDSLYLVGTYNDSIWGLKRQSVILQLEQQNLVNSNLCSNLNATCQSKIQLAQAANATILYSNNPEENEYLVNEIYLQTVAMGSQNFTATQQQTLYNIAHQCPELGGNAVYRARSIYALIANERYSEDCEQLPQARMEMASVDTCYKEVRFFNPSLEGTVGYGKVPPQWDICESTPNVEPFFSSLSPSNGNSYVSIGSIPNVFQESFGQILADTMFNGQKYSFLLDAAIVPTGSGSFSIWIGDSSCDKEQLIYTTSSTDTAWHTYVVKFEPLADYTHFMISAENNSFNLIDNLRPFPNPASCDTTTVINSLLPTAQEEEAGFKVYPNPNTQGLLTVEWTENIVTEQLLIIDALGREVYNTTVDKKLTSKELDIRNLPNGTYIILLKNKAAILGRKKLIVLKE